MKRIFPALLGSILFAFHSHGADLPPWVTIEVELRKEYTEAVARDTAQGIYPGIQWVDGRPIFSPSQGLVSQETKDLWRRDALESLEKSTDGEGLSPAVIDSLINHSVLTGDRRFVDLACRQIGKLWSGSDSGIPSIPDDWEEWRAEDKPTGLAQAMTALRMLKIRRLFDIKEFDEEISAWAGGIGGRNIQDGPVFLAASDVSKDIVLTTKALRSSLASLKAQKDKPDPAVTRIAGAVLFCVVSGGTAVPLDGLTWCEIAGRSEEGALGINEGLAFASFKKGNGLAINFGNAGNEAAKVFISLPYSGRIAGTPAVYRCRILRLEESRAYLGLPANTAGEIRFEVPTRPPFEQWIPSAGDGSSGVSTELKVFISDEESGRAKSSLKIAVQKKLEEWIASDARALPRTDAEFDRRREQVRYDLTAALGGMPERTPLNPQEVGSVSKAGYRIEKWIVESRPQFYVPVNLYVPENVGRSSSGVIVVADDSARGKASDDVQNLCIDLVRAGHFALVFDPPGMGERSFAGGPLNAGETRKAAVQCLLAGVSYASYITWDTIRMIDFIVDRPGLDVQRLGIVGIGAGSAPALTVAALDERIRVAATSGLRRYSGESTDTMIPGDISGNYDALGQGLLVLPRPLLIETEESEKEFYRPLAVAYGIRGSTDAFSLSVGPAPSKSQAGDVLRHRSVVDWMGRLLDEPKAGDGDSVSSKELSEEGDLQCTQGARVSGDTIFHLNLDRLERVDPAEADLSNVTACREHISAVRKKIGNIVRYPARRMLSSVEDRGGFQTVDAALERIVLRSGDDVPIPGLLLVPKKVKGREPAIIYLGDGGKLGAEGKDPALWPALLESGHTVFSIDPRGTGETRPDVGGRESECLLFEMGTSIFAERVRDVLAAVEFVTGKSDGTFGEVALVGEGSGALLAVYAAAISERVSQVVVVGMIDEYLSLAGNAQIDEAYSGLIPGVLTEYDLADVVSVISPRPVLLVNSVEGEDRINTPPQIDRIYATTISIETHLGDFFEYTMVSPPGIPKFVADRFGLSASKGRE